MSNLIYILSIASGILFVLFLIFSIITIRYAKKIHRQSGLIVEYSYRVTDADREITSLKSQLRFYDINKPEAIYKNQLEDRDRQFIEAELQHNKTLAEKDSIIASKNKELENKVWQYHELVAVQEKTAKEKDQLSRQLDALTNLAPKFANSFTKVFEIFTDNLQSINKKKPK